MPTWAWIALVLILLYAIYFVYKNRDNAVRYL